MQSDRWARIEQVFADALAVPAISRHVFLAQECGVDTALLREIEGLLHSHETPGVLDAQPLATETQAIEPSLVPGTCLGAWRIDTMIGRGGMGEVYAATRIDTAFEQRAALKLLRYEAAGQLERFQSERRILARLEHPGIARLLDGGVAADGRPYTVMEYVQGQPITHYCRANQSSLRERLILFAQVCDAVGFAHRNLVIHRDLKPDNIFVATDGGVKLLDFGIAKLLDAAALPRNGDNTIAPFTPDYAAPEQMSGEPVTTATDIYALGVLLFELLTGERPLRTRDLPSTQALKLLLDRPAPAPSRIAQGSATPPVPARLLRGDLDAIVAKCLRKEAGHRYETVNGLKRDLDAHLRNEPVLAREGARTYVLGRLLRRYRWAVASVCALILALAAGMAGTAWQAQRAQAQAERANSVRDFLVSLFETADTDTPRDQRATPEEIVDLGGERILGDNEMPLETKADLLAVLARVTLSMDAEAEKLTVALLTLSDEVYEKSDPQWINAHSLRAWALANSQQNAEVVKLLEPLQADMLNRADAASIEGLITLSASMAQLEGRSESALNLQRDITVAAMKNAQADPRSALAAMIAEADLFATVHRFKESLERAESALAFWKERELPLTSDMLRLHASIGNSASSLGDVARGEAAYREAIALSERLYKRPHRDTAWFVGLLGSYLVSLGRLEEAESYVLRGLSMRRDLLGKTHPETLFAMAALARLRAAQNRIGEALAVLSEGVKICAQTGLLNDACVRLLQTRGRIYAQKPDFAAAEADMNAAIALQRKTSGEDGAMVASQFAYLAELQRRMGRNGDAITTAEYALALFDKAGGGHWADVAMARSQRAWANLEIGKLQEALAEITEVEAQFSKQATGKLLIRIGMLSVKARALARLNRSNEAKTVAADALVLVAQTPATDKADAARLKRIAETGQDD